jgi:F-type H+-transporting ATPase subunit epsilon
MAEKIAFDLVSPERLLLSDMADMVTIPATEGYMGVMAGHAPVVSSLRPGMINVLKDGAESRFFIRGGFAEISAAKVTVLAEEAIPFAELDLQILDQRIKDAEDDLIAAGTDAEKARVAETLDDLRMVKAAF